MITPEQKNAIEANDKLILVKAGAGTGKTEVLTRRIIRLLEDNTDLSIQEMAVITFTNKATENLLSRLKLYLYHQWKNTKNSEEKKRYRYELENLNNCQISTIHKFCKSILDAIGPIYFEDFDYAPVYNVSESSLHQAIEITLEQWLKEKESSKQENYHEKVMPVHKIRTVVLGIYNTIRSKGISIRRVIEQTQESLQLEVGYSRYIKQELVEILSLLYKNHRQLRLQTLDPDNLLEYCYKLLVRRQDILQDIKKMYRCIFVDEFQDTSLYQSGIIRKICDGHPDSPSLFVVGDSKQSIYQFRGADLTSYESVEKWISRNGRVLTLSTNFRSTGELVVYVNMLFDKIKEQFPELQFSPEPLQSNQKADEPINLRKAYTWLLANQEQSQAQLVAQYIKEQIDQGVSANHFAILFRKNYPMVAFSKELEALGIPYQLIGAGNFYNQKEIIDTYKVINFLLQPNSALVTEEALETLYFNNDIESLNALYSEIKPEVAIRTPAQILELIYQKTKIREKLVESSPQAAANLNKLKELIRNLNIKENLQLNEIANWLALMIVTHQEEQQSDVPVSDDINAVTLITIHKAKGLEYPIVILPGLDETLSRDVLNPAVVYNKTTGLEFCYIPYFGEKGVRIPSANYDNTVISHQQDLYSEELRILYVALTRAQKHLVFVGSEDCPKKSICFQNWLQII